MPDNDVKLLNNSSLLDTGAVLLHQQYAVFVAIFKHEAQNALIHYYITFSYVHLSILNIIILLIN